MKLEQQVCSLELAKRLKELGVKQESLFMYQIFTEAPTARPYLVRSNYTGGRAGNKEMEALSAFTVAELGEMLPALVGQDQKYLYEWKDLLGNKTIALVDFDSKGMNMYEEFTGKKEADNRGKMLIYLIENNLLSTKE